MDNLLTVMR